jgi:steroid delta-isomerase-like uncharacterized protein
MSRPSIHVVRASLLPLLATLSVACGPSGPGAGPSDEVTARAADVAIARAFVDAINARDLDALDTLVAPDVVRHSQSTPGVKVESLSDLKTFLRDDFRMVPDSRQEILHLVAGEDRAAGGRMVAGWFRYTGTQEGPMGPLPATGREVGLDFAGFLRIEEGRIAEMWVVWDNLALLRQLDLMDAAPMMAPPAIDSTGSGN